MSEEAFYIMSIIRIITEFYYEIHVPWNKMKEREIVILVIFIRNMFRRWCEYL